jgi:hypothetical protein
VKIFSFKDDPVGQVNPGFREIKFALAEAVSGDAWAAVP